MSLKPVKAFLKLLKKALKRLVGEERIEMATPVSLRVCGVEFDRVEVVGDTTSQVTVIVKDRTFGEFPLDASMKLEIKEDGRWKILPLPQLIRQLLLAKVW